MEDNFSTINSSWEVDLCSRVELPLQVHYNCHGIVSSQQNLCIPSSVSEEIGESTGRQLRVTKKIFLRVGWNFNWKVSRHSSHEPHYSTTGILASGICPGTNNRPWHSFHLLFPGLSSGNNNYRLVQCSTTAYYSGETARNWDSCAG